MTSTWHGYLGVQQRGVIALPAELRRRLHLDEPGAQLEITERVDGVLELRAALPVPADQAWFWNEQWQKREREVDEHVAAGHVGIHESTEDFLAHLDDVAAKPRVKFETTPAFDTDVRRLKVEHRVAFTQAVREKFAPACDAYAVDPTTFWPASLRVKSVRGTAGALEMNWSFASPDGRATFELVTVDGDLRCRWRRVDDHDVFKAP